MSKLKKDFYRQENVVAIAQQLLGKVLVSKIEGKLTSGIITETEAYNGTIDRASHAFHGKRTQRTEVMYSEGGVAYVYLCYGIHSLFNVVTGLKNIPQAVLIRSIFPQKGIEWMCNRRRKKISDNNLTIGPGNVSQALGIHYTHSGMSLSGNVLWIEDDGYQFPPHALEITPRIGVDYAGPHALWPYRFVINPEFLIV
jgi:DNA-3-methyladenine glycosylase